LEILERKKEASKGGHFRFFLFEALSFDVRTSAGRCPKTPTLHDKLETLFWKSG